MKLDVFSVILLVAALAVPGFAIVTDAQSTSETDPQGTMGFNWGYVYKYKGSSAVAVDPYWLLTAHHVADDAPTWSMTIGSTTYTETERIYHSAADDDNHDFDADLALIRLDQALPGWYELYTGSLTFQNPNLKLTGLLVGYGYAGTVDTVNDTYTWNTGTSRIQRWGTNKIDALTTIGGTWSTDGFVMYFDYGNTAYEAGIATYDSGGGVFVEDGGSWKLAGVNLGVGYTGGSSPPYDLCVAGSVPAYAEWIDQTVPEPATLSLLAVGGLVVAGRNWRLRARLRSVTG